MLKRQIFGKTERLGSGTYEWILTEKLDGSNLCFFKRTDALFVCTRKRIMDFDTLCVCHGTMSVKDYRAMKDGLYKGLYDWLCEHGMNLCTQLDDGAAICGEWLGMGKIKYPDTFKPFNMFAKARVDSDSSLSDLQLTRFNYDPDTFHFVFADDIVPDYIGTVPVIERISEVPTVAVLDRVYNEYTCSVNRTVEGIVITQAEVPDRRCKYVRMKAGKFGPHISAEEMAELRAEWEKRAAAQKEQRA